MNVSRIEHQTGCGVGHREPVRNLRREFHIADPHAREAHAAEIIDPSIFADRRPGAGGATSTNSGRTPISIFAPTGRLS
jgi:hypothetical protein